MTHAWSDWADSAPMPRNSIKKMKKSEEKATSHGGKDIAHAARAKKNRP
ncbi:hypothetical protein NHH73_23400 [Oxalobacteraceae bacterium OTU3CINTB1]|nr:hypothetical protein NHH73_23400 [Oxalobacteraceae bacterium OTU3CINTB1]